MAQAAANLPHHETTIVSVEYAPDNRVLVTLQTADGPLHLTMSATALLSFVNMATETINRRLGQFMAAAS